MKALSSNYIPVHSMHYIFHEGSSSLLFVYNICCLPISMFILCYFYVGAKHVIAVIVFGEKGSANMHIVENIANVKFCKCSVAK